MAMFVQAINQKDEALMKLALKDRLHQPYRMKLIPGLDEITEVLKNEESVLGCVLSGAGPSVLVVSKKDNLEKIKSTVKEIWGNLNVKCDIMTLTPEVNGAQIIE